MTNRLVRSIYLQGFIHGGLVWALLSSSEMPFLYLFAIFVAAAFLATLCFSLPRHHMVLRQLREETS